MSSLYHRLNQYFDRSPWTYALLAFCILLVNKLGVDVRGGEEQYLAFAFQFVNPSWIPNSFTYTEFAGTRIVFQYLVGPLLYWLSFEQATIALRAVNFLLFSIPLGFLFHRLNIKPLVVFVFFQLFVMSKQSLVGGEWIFQSFEPKSVAYILVFWALYYLTQSKHKLVVIHLALACYFHIVVGGWVFIAYVLYLAWEAEFKRIISSGILLSVLLSPLLIYIYFGMFATPFETDVNLNQVYVYQRLPHHLGIWKTTDYFVQRSLAGTVMLIVMLISSKCWLPRLPHSFKVFGKLLLVMLALNICFVGVAAIDHFVLDNSGGLGLKYYPFRTGSIVLFFALFFLVSIAYEWVKQKQKVLVFSGVIVFALFLNQGLLNVQRSIKHVSANTDFKQLTNLLKETTSPDAVFLLMDISTNDKEYISFGRWAERENFIVPKFVSAESGKLIEWTRRVNIQHEIDKDHGKLNDYANKEVFDHVVCKSVLKDQELVAEIAPYKVYKLK